MAYLRGSGIGLSMIILNVVIGSFYFVVVTPIAFTVGYKPVLFKKSASKAFEPMACRPKVKKVWQIIGAILLLLFIGTICLAILWALGVWVFGDVIQSPVGRVILVSVFTILIAWIAWRVWRKTETHRVVAACIRAKKEKVCPIIEFK